MRCSRLVVIRSLTYGSPRRIRRSTVDTLSVASCFIMYPLAPARRSRSAYTASSCIESTRIGRSGSVLLMLLSRSNPSRPGKEISRTTISGSRRANASGTTDGSSASPHTTRSGSWLISIASPCRTMGWSSITNTRCFCCTWVTLRTSGAKREPAGNDGATVKTPSKLERSTDHVRAIIHDVQSQSGVGARHIGHACTIVLDLQSGDPLEPAQRHDQLGSVAMLDRIVHCFLRNVIEMGGDVDVSDQDGLGALEATADAEQVLDLAGPPLERRHEPVGVGHNRQEAARQLPGLVDRLVHEADDLLDFGCLRNAVGRELTLQHLAHERDAGQVLAEAVVQVATDLPLLPGADLENRLFHPLALGDVDPGCDHVRRPGSDTRQYRARPRNAAPAAISSDQIAFGSGDGLLHVESREIALEASRLFRGQEQVTEIFSANLI